MSRTSRIIREWPGQSRRAAERMIETFGTPSEVGPSRLVWKHAGSWRRVTAYRRRPGSASPPVVLAPSRH